MMQSTSHELAPGLHVAIIMDGNGRWATARGLPRIAGHKEGAESVRRVIEAAPELGVGTLTLYAFSSDNWRRPKAEVSTLMRMLESYLKEKTGSAVENGICISVIGRRDRIPVNVKKAVERAEEITQHCNNLHVRLAVDYSSRDSILAACVRARSVEIL